VTADETYSEFAFAAGAIEDQKPAILRGTFAFIHPTAKIGARTIIFPHAYIGPHVTIGVDCVIGPGSCIGQPGFGYEPYADTWRYREHKAGVVIGAEVHVGANACVDQGRYRPTTIGEGCKIDNNVHIAHNAILGRNVLVIANAMVAGSVEVGDHAIINPGATIRDHAKIGERAIVGMGAAVTKDVPPNEVWVGNPAKFMRVREDDEGASRRP
jgi:UDP-3-O-[3-hydroxymyristoyl] glucosamine N-acyltransferase